MKKIAWAIDDGDNSALLVSERRIGESRSNHFERMLDLATEMICIQGMNYKKIKIDMFEVKNYD